MKVGKNTRILTSYFNFGSEPYLIEIGENCTVTSGVKFITHDASIATLFNYLGEKRRENSLEYTKMGRIKIKDNCMIGVNTIILPNVEIGNNVIVGAGSVVTKSIPDNVVVAGNPAKIIMTLEEYIEKTKDNLIRIKKPNDKNEILLKVPKIEKE